MKLMHISDLHIGKVYREVSLLEDQKLLLKQIIELALENKVDGLLIAGDIYQRNNPSAQSVEVVNQFITELARRKIKTFIISGNHDSIERVSYLADLIRDSGIYISNNFNGVIDSITINDEFGPVNISLLPFVKTSSIRNIYEDDSITDTQKAWLAIKEHNPIDVKQRNILLMHQLVLGAQICDSEEMYIGGLDAIRTDSLSEYDYVALGHIHSPQNMSKNVRYCGSLMPYSFSEVKQKKSVTIIEMKEKGNLKVDTINLNYPHQFIEIKGTLAEILTHPYSLDYASITLTDEMIEIDAKTSVYMVYPNCMRLQVLNSKTSQGVVEIDDNFNPSIDPLVLFQDFYKFQNNGVAPSEKHLEFVAKMLETVGNE